MKLQANFLPRRDGTFGRVGDYVIDPDGTVEIADHNEAVRLVGTGNFVKAPAKEPEKEPDAKKPEPMLISKGPSLDDTLDLMTLSKDQLLTLARDELELEVSGRNSEQTIREAIMAYIAR